MKLMWWSIWTTAIGDADVEYAGCQRWNGNDPFRQTFRLSYLRHHARLRYLPVRRCLSHHRSRGYRAWCLVSSWPKRMNGSQGNGRVLWRKTSHLIVGGRKETGLYEDNCGGHNQTADSEEALRKIWTTVRYLPPNSTQVTQPCDSFIIQKLKDEFRRRWELKKLEIINDGEWKNGPRIWQTQEPR
jgi:DDE superfamily endonuclease